MWKPYHFLQHKELTPKMRDWLLDSGSFMERLKYHGIKNSVVDVLQQSWQFPEKEERDILQIKSRCYALVREVVIRNEDIVWMVARTVIPQKTLTGCERQLLHLKNRSLGSFLFKNPFLQRSEFEIADVSSGMKSFDTLKQQSKCDIKKCWARRSVFTTHGKKLLLTEVFSPVIDLL